LKYLTTYKASVEIQEPFLICKNMNLLTKIKRSNIKLTDAAAIKAFLVGKKVKIIGADPAKNTTGINSHGLQIGKEWTISQNVGVYVNISNAEAIYIIDGVSGSGNGIYLSNIKLLNSGITPNDFIAEIQLLEEEEKKLKESKQKAKDIIKFMQENEIGEFDEDVYEVYKVIKKIKTGTDIEKAIEISKLLKK
jgi:hypothetical protein